MGVMAGANTAGPDREVATAAQYSIAFPLPGAVEGKRLEGLCRHLHRDDLVAQSTLTLCRGMAGFCSRAL